MGTEDLPNIRKTVRTLIFLEVKNDDFRIRLNPVFIEFQKLFACDNVCDQIKKEFFKHKVEQNRLKMRLYSKF